MDALTLPLDGTGSGADARAQAAGSGRPPPPPGFNNSSQASSSAPPALVAPGLAAPGQAPGQAPAAPPGFAGEPLAADGSAGYGGSEVAHTAVLDRTSARGKRRYKWDALWGGALPAALLREIQMDEVATFSVTDVQSAEIMSRALAALEGVSEHSVVTDATACVGGNAISLARYFRHVNAVELDPVRCAMLQHNLAVCLRQQQVQLCPACKAISVCCKCPADPQKPAAATATAAGTGKEEAGVWRPPPIVGLISVRQGDCLRVCPTLQSDIVFLDPPWGGLDYSQRDTVDLFISGQSLDQVCSALSKNTRYLAIKVPYNVNLEPTLSDPTCRFVSEVLLDKMKMVILEYAAAPGPAPAAAAALSQDQLNFLQTIGLKM